MMWGWQHGYLCEFGIIDDHKGGTIAVNLAGRLNKCALSLVSNLMFIHNSNHIRREISVLFSKHMHQACNNRLKLLNLCIKHFICVIQIYNSIFVGL
uniref:Uncharacterized protein n=1 Tax=Callorhinchus milii TaxID=7868 RepID=A0A4W3K5A6_CALMI